MTRTLLQPDPASRCETKPLLCVSDLAVSFLGESGQRVRAVNGVSFSIHPRQTLAVVGESGCGKSVTALALLRLIPSPPGQIDRGSVLLDGRDLLSLEPGPMRQVRGRDVAMIFQEPMTSLNPVLSIGDQIIESIRLYQSVGRRQAIQIALEAMSEVGIPRPRDRLGAYPHQFSGGMRQRVMIAMALACRPRLLLADEPTTALDVTIQAQILELLRRVQRDRGMAIMLITHDLGVVAQNADVVCVMYAGRAVEYANVLELFENPLHPYTRGLLRCKPRLREKRRRLVTMSDIVDDPGELRCQVGREPGLSPWWPVKGASTPMMTSDDYALVEVEPQHWVACSSIGQDVAPRQRRPDIDFRRESVIV
jgi:ABC-type dipeptide/oligopeptide/nickel transport system ATPase component